VVMHMIESNYKPIYLHPRRHYVDYLACTFLKCLSV